MKEIIFIRHAESQANADGIWNGRTDGPLSEDGRISLDPLARRLTDWEFDVVVSSPLRRARETAEAFSNDVVVDDRFTEIDLGRWEGMAFDDVLARHGEELQEAIVSRTKPMGGTGESIEETTLRATAAVDDLASRLGEGQAAAVVTHGGFLQSVLHRHLAGKDRRVHAFTENTAITRIVWEWGRPRLATFNDVGHLGPRSRMVEAHLAEGDPVLTLVRHGQTRANVEQIWQGQDDWDLDDLGHRQAETLAEWYGRQRTVFSSPLKRASTTARYLAQNGVVAVEGLKEISMGRWEGMKSDQIIESWPGVLEQIYRDGVDLRRGETGESWAELTARFSNTIASLEPARGEPTVVVAHGGSIRSYVSSLTRTTDTHAESLFTPSNTAVTHIAMTDRGPEILDYAVATHLESVE